MSFVPEHGSVQLRHVFTFPRGEQIRLHTYIYLI